MTNCSYEGHHPDLPKSLCLVCGQPWPCEAIFRKKREAALLFEIIRHYKECLERIRGLPSTSSLGNAIGVRHNRTENGTESLNDSKDHNPEVDCHGAEPGTELTDEEFFGMVQRRQIERQQVIDGFDHILGHREVVNLSRRCHQSIPSHFFKLNGRHA